MKLLKQILYFYFFYISLLLISLLTTISCTPKSKKLTGVHISSLKSDTMNYTEKAFDEDLTTEFTSSPDLNGWVGIALDSPHVITKIGWSQKRKNSGYYLLGVFEGANDPSFIDAVPIHMITKEEEPKKLIYADIESNLAFKYLRYVGPLNVTCKITQIEFYGYKYENDTLEEELNFYQPSNGTPFIIINTKDSYKPVDRNEMVVCNLLVVNNNKKELKANAIIKLRGNTSLLLIKKQYQIIFDKPQNLLGMHSTAKNWRLIANYADKSLLRNTVGLELSSLLKMKYTAQCIFVDVIFNGEFLGNFNLCEVIEIGSGRVELSAMDKNDTEEPEITGGYLVEISGQAKDEEVYGNTTKGIPYKYFYPEPKDMNEAQKKYIDSYMNQMEKEVYSGIVDHIDIDSCINYFFIQDIGANHDAAWNIYLTKERNEDKFYFGPVWDFDISFGNDERFVPIQNFTYFIFKAATSAGTTNKFLQAIFSNEKVLDKVKSKWKKLREEGIISGESLGAFIDKKVKEMEESIRLNFIKWDVLIRKVKRNPFVWCTYENEIEYLKSFIDYRIKMIDDIIKEVTPEKVNEKVKIYNVPGTSIFPIGIIDPSCLEEEYSSEI